MLNFIKFVARFPADKYCVFHASHNYLETDDSVLAYFFRDLIVSMEPSCLMSIQHAKNRFSKIKPGFYFSGTREKHFINTTMERRVCEILV